jgi:WD40 repeat protein
MSRLGTDARGDKDARIRRNAKWPHPRTPFAPLWPTNAQVWRLDRLQLVKTLQQNRGRILALAISRDEKLLFSAGDDGRVYVWDVTASDMPCICQIYTGADSGDIYALAFADTTSTLYVGCKNTSIQACVG